MLTKITIFCRNTVTDAIRGAIKGDLFRNILVFACLTTVLAFVFTVETIILVVLCILRKQWLVFLKGMRDKKHSKVCFCHKSDKTILDHVDLFYVSLRINNNNNNPSFIGLLFITPFREQMSWIKNGGVINVVDFLCVFVYFLF